MAHRSLISLTICSSLVHAGIMLAQAMADESERFNLLGDVPALLLVAIVLGAAAESAAGLTRGIWYQRMRLGA